MIAGIPVRIVIIALKYILDIGIKELTSGSKIRKKK